MAEHRSRPTRIARMRAGLAEAIARKRVSLGFVFGAVVLGLSEPTAMSLAVGLPIAACGEALRIWAAGHLNKSREVTCSGPYRWCAHPLYVGSSVMGAGLGVASASPVVVALIATYLTVTLTAAIRTEEAFLRRTFGDGYERYKRGDEPGAGGSDTTTGRDRGFSLAQVGINREYRAVIGFGVVVLLLVLKATYNALF